MVYFGYRSSFGLKCVLYFAITGFSEMHLGKCQVCKLLAFSLNLMSETWTECTWHGYCPDGASLLSTCFDTVHLVSFYWMLSFVLLTYHYVVDSAKKILYKPDTVYYNNNNNSISSEGNQQSNSLKLQWTLLIFPDNNCTTITVILKGTLRSE